MPVLKSDGSQGLDPDFVPTDPNHLVPLWFLEEIAALRTLPVINTTTMPDAEVGVEFDALINVTGVPTPVPSTPVPPPSGLYLDQDWHVRGKPMTGGDYTWSARATNGLGDPFDRTFAQRVNQRPVSLTSSLPDGIPTVLYGARIDWLAWPAGSATIFAGSLPEDYILTNHGTYAEITGTTDFIGVATFTVRIGNPIDHTDVVLSIAVGALIVPVILDDEFPDVVINVPSSGQVAVTGTPTPELWADGAPVGFVMQPNGAWTLTASVLGTYDVEVHAASVAGQGVKVLPLEVIDVFFAPTWSSPAAGTLTPLIINTETRIPLIAPASPPAVVILKSGVLNPGCGIDNTTTPPQLVMRPTVAGAGTAFELEASNGIAPAAARTFTQPVHQAAYIVEQTLLQATVGVAGSQQLTIGGYPTGGTVTKLAGPAQLSVGAGGLLSWTTSLPAVGDYQVSLSVTNGVGTATVYNYTWSVITASQWTPAAGYAWYLLYGRGLTYSSGANVSQWTDPVAGINIHATGFTEPVEDAANKLVNFTSSPHKALANTSLDLPLPSAVLLRVRPKAAMPDNTPRQIVRSATKNLYFVDSSTAGQDKFQFAAGGVTLDGPLGNHTDAWHSVLVWVESTTKVGIRHGATEAISTSASTTTGFQDFQLNGSTTPGDFDTQMVTAYYDVTRFDDATKRGALIASADNAGSGSSPPPPVPPTVIADNDSRILSLGHSGLANLSNYSTNIEAYLGTTQTYPNQSQNNRSILVYSGTDPLGFKATAGEYGLKRVTRNGSPMWEHLVKNTFPSGYTVNDFRARLRGYGQVRVRTSSSATPPDRVWFATAFELDQSMIDTDNRQVIFDLCHASGNVTGGGSNPALGPGIKCGRSAYGSALAMDFFICRVSSTASNAGANTQDFVWSTTPVANQLYKLVGVWQPSYRDASNGYANGDGYIDVWLQCPAHYGGQITKIVTDVERNYFNESQGYTNCMSIALYRWFLWYGLPGAPSYASPLVTQHRMWSTGVLAIKDTGSGSPTLGHLMLFAKLNAILGV